MTELYTEYLKKLIEIQTQRIEVKTFANKNTKLFKKFPEWYHSNKWRSKNFRFPLDHKLATEIIVIPSGIKNTMIF